MGYAVFDYLAWVGVIDHVVIDCCRGSWSEGLRSDLQLAISHLQKLVVEEKWGRSRGCCGRGRIGETVHYDGRRDVGDGVAREDGGAARC